jgi:predicted PurR-regulated permease PerM
MRTMRPTAVIEGKVTVPPAEIPGLRGLLSLGVAVAVVSALYFARDVLIPITLAVLLSFLVAPIAGWFRRWHCGRAGSVVLAMLLPLVVLLGLGTIIGTQISALVQEVPAEQTIILKKIDTIRNATIGNYNSFVKQAGKELQHAAAPKAEHHSADRAPPPERVSVVPAPISPTDVAKGIIGPMLDPLAIMFIVFTVASFILLYREDLRDRMIRLFGSTDLHRTTTALDDAAERLSQYFLTKFLINAGFGIVVGLGLFAIGVPGAILWGVLTTLARFIPYIGSFIAAVPPLLLAAAVDPDWSMAIWTLALFVVGEILVGQVVEPMMYGRTTGLSPISVVVAAIFWGWLWGPIGLLLSTPLTLCFVVLGRHVERLEFLDVLLGDRPALTPVETFYQRALAGDPDEALDQAEVLLRDRSLCGYYDTVVLPALRLAASDAARGVLYPGQLERITMTVAELLDGLSDQDDAEKLAPAIASRNDPVGPSLAEQTEPHLPAPRLHLPPRAQLAPIWQGAAPVLCIAGRGPLDGEACAIIAQLLSKHGIGTRVVAHDAAARTHVASLDTDGVALVFLCYLDIAAAPSSLRYLAQRMRNACPGVPITAGFWTSKADYERYADFQAAIGATYYPTSLRDAVDQVLGAAIATAQSALVPAILADHEPEPEEHVFKLSLPLQPGAA